MEKKSALIALIIVEVIAIYGLFSILNYTESGPSGLDASLNTMKFNAQQEVSCEVDADCISLTSICGTGKCDTDLGTCYILYNSTTDVCRERVGECDVAEYCTGNLEICPADSFEHDETSCSGGVCQNGVCIIQCTDSDGGLDYYSKGEIYQGGQVIFEETGQQGEDINVTSPTETKLKLSNGTWINVVLNGEYDFVFGDGKITEIKFISLDNQQNSIQISYTKLEDMCLEGKLIERVCGTDTDEEFVCPNGCVDGACNSSDFNGGTTNVSEEQDTISNFTLERNSFGKIRFVEEVDISRFKENPDLLSYIRIGYKKIKVDTGNLTELINKKANLTFYDIDMNNPLLYYKGSLCNSTMCTARNYKSNTKTFTAEVARFSEYEIVEGPYCGDDLCQEDNGEDCDDCEDCACSSGESCVSGECQDDDEDGSSSTNNNDANSCQPNWNCTWSDCISSKQEKTCVDLNNCGKPYPRDHGMTKICVVQGCQDNDGDGYGIGIECLGEDLNDSNPNIRDVNVSGDGTDKPSGDFFKENSLYIIIGLISLIVIVGIIIGVILILHATRKPELGAIAARSKKKIDKEEDDRFT